MSSDRLGKQGREDKAQERLKEEKLNKLRNDTLREDYTKLLTMPEFQRVMHDIIAKGGMFKSVMTGNSQTYHLSGRQDFCREIWAGILEVDKEAAFELLKPKWDDESLND